MWKLRNRAAVIEADKRGAHNNEQGSDLLTAEKLDDQILVATVSVKLLGLPRDCWRCGSTSTALVGIMEFDGDVLSEDLVLCQNDELLKFAWDHLPIAARRRWKVGNVAYRSSKTAQSRYLSNGCANCNALFGAFPIFHEEVPGALATRGNEAFVTLDVVAMPARHFQAAYERWE